MWVDDFTEAEANEFMDKRKLYLTSEGQPHEDRCAELFRKVGTRALSLLRVRPEGEEAPASDVFNEVNGVLTPARTPEELVKAKWPVANQGCKDFLDSKRDATGLAARRELVHKLLAAGACCVCQWAPEDAWAVMLCFLTGRPAWLGSSHRGGCTPEHNHAIHEGQRRGGGEVQQEDTLLLVL